MFSIVYNNCIAVSSIFDDIPRDWFVVDCRPLIDGPGNAEELVQNLLAIGLEQLKNGSKVCFACDYGHSRSNMLAALAIRDVVGFELVEAIEYLKSKHPESAIKAGILSNYLCPSGSQKAICFGISGASGIIGSNLLHLLTNAGQRPIGLSRAQHGPYLESSNAIKLLIEENGLTDLIHLAYPKPFNSYHSSKQSFNHLFNLLEACTSTGSTLHYVSGWIVFDGHPGEFVDESCPPKPHSIYAQTKLLQEQLITYHGLNNGLKYRIYRLPGVFSFDTLEPRFLRYIADCALTKQDIFVHDFLNGSAVVPLAPLAEIVELLADQLLLKDSDQAGMVHLTRLQYNKSVKEIAEIVATNHGIKVESSPVSRGTFSGRFVSRILPRGSPPLSSYTDELPVVTFIEDLINVKRTKT